jgi:hypothetical protein
MTRLRDVREGTKGRRDLFLDESDGILIYLPLRSPKNIHSFPPLPLRFWSIEAHKKALAFLGVSKQGARGVQKRNKNKNKTAGMFPQPQKPSTHSALRHFCVCLCGYGASYGHLAWWCMSHIASRLWPLAIEPTRLLLSPALASRLSSGSCAEADIYVDTHNSQGAEWKEKQNKKAHVRTFLAAGRCFVVYADGRTSPKLRSNAPWRPLASWLGLSRPHWPIGHWHLNEHHFREQDPRRPLELAGTREKRLWTFPNIFMAFLYFLCCLPAEKRPKNTTHKT